MTFSYLERRNRRRRRKKLFSLLLFLFLAISLFFFVSRLINKNSPEQIKTPVLKETVENSLKESKAAYAIAIKNLKTEESYYSNEYDIFEAGSLYKLWVMAQTYEQIQNNKLTEDEILSQDVNTLNAEFNIDPDLADLTEGVVTLSVRDALNQMITISHNYAALLLTQKIKLSSVAQFLTDKGFNESSVGTDGSPPKTSARDILDFYEKLYRGELGSPENTEKMITQLKNQQLNEGLPKYLPAGRQGLPEKQVANKTGDIGWFKHDTGIVYTEKGDYIIVVMSESESPLGAQEKIALLSKAVFDYFNNK